MLEAKKHDGTPLFNVLEVTTLCDKCLAEGKLDCPHKTELPSWKTSERQELVKTLMTGRNSEMYKREACGIITRSSNNAFNVPNVDRLGLRSNFVGLSILGVPKEIFVAIDPCGGGASAMAITTGVYTRDDSLVIVGADAFTVSSDEEQVTSLVFILLPVLHLRKPPILQH